MFLLGNGVGNGITTQGGATGIGLAVYGGVTSGDGLAVFPLGIGHGVNIAANGSNKHGITVTGGTGGTSDGIKAVAGTGGVPIRGDITGNITGNLSGSIGSYTGDTPQTGDAFARLGAPAGASVSADVVAVKSDTASIKTATNTGVAPGASGGLLISGSNSGTTTLGAMTVTGATTLTGAVSMPAGLSAVITGSLSGNVGGISGTTQTFDALQTAQNSAHGAGSWATATGFATPTNITAATGIDVTKWAGAAVATPATAGVPEVDVKAINNVATTAVTTVKAVQGLTTADTIATVTGLTASDVGAIKTQTDKLTFTVANQVDSNVQSVNDVLLQGAGVTGNSWRPV